MTNASGATRLGLRNARGPRAGDILRLEANGRPALEIMATPCRHGPPLSHAIVGDVIGFAVRRAGEDRVALWVTGDTVLYRGVRRVARALDVDVAIVNVGGVGFPITGTIRYTMTGADALRLIGDLQPLVAIPAHYYGWSHFRDGKKDMRAAVRDAPDEVRTLVRWLPDGEATEI